jgi:hypothetical protein
MKRRKLAAKNDKYVECSTCHNAGANCTCIDRRQRLKDKASDAANKEMPVPSLGFREKTYWRKLDEKYHAFVNKNGVFAALCGVITIPGPGSQQIRRPVISERCPECDAYEMKRRGMRTSLPPSAGKE